jgi:hypothetical protein
MRGRLSRSGLATYTRHSFVNPACVDRTFYAPLPRAIFRVCGSVPERFRFVRESTGRMHPALGRRGAREHTHTHTADRQVTPSAAQAF